MDEQTLKTLLQPLIKMKQMGGFTPEEWWKTVESVADKIPDIETQSALTLFKGMVHDPGNDASPEHEIPGSHGVRQLLLLRGRKSSPKERER